MRERSILIEKACNYVWSESIKRGYTFRKAQSADNFLASKSKQITNLVNKSSRIFGVDKNNLKRILGI